MCLCSLNALNEGKAHNGMLLHLLSVILKSTSQKAAEQNACGVYKAFKQQYTPVQTTVHLKQWLYESKQA